MSSLLKDWKHFRDNLPDGAVEWACAGPFVVTWGNEAAARIEELEEILSKVEDWMERSESRRMEYLSRAETAEARAAKYEAALRRIREDRVNEIEAFIIASTALKQVAQ